MASSGRQERQAEVALLLIGPDRALASFPGEFFVEHGLRLKRERLVADTLFVGYSNGHLGYFPTNRAAGERLRRRQLVHRRGRRRRAAREPGPRRLGLPVGTPAPDAVGVRARRMTEAESEGLQYRGRVTEEGHMAGRIAIGLLLSALAALFPSTASAQEIRFGFFDETVDVEW